jgi:hypothetical protein
MISPRLLGGEPRYSITGTRFEWITGAKPLLPFVKQSDFKRAHCADTDALSAPYGVAEGAMLKGTVGVSATWRNLFSLPPRR